MTTIIKGVVFINWALLDCEDKWTRQKLRCTHSIGNKRVKGLFHKHVKAVEEKITKKLLEAERISVLHDGCIKGGVHYIGLFACYNQVHTVVLKGKTILK